MNVFLYLLCNNAFLLKSVISSHNSCVLSFKKLKVAINVTNIKDINLKILCSFIHMRSTTSFSSQKRCEKRWQFIFIYNNYINFIHTWGNFDQLIKVTPSTIKVTPFVGGVTLIGLWFDVEYLQKNWSSLLWKRYS